MLKTLFVITLVSFAILLETSSSSKLKVSPVSLSDGGTPEKQIHSSLIGTSVHKTSLKNRPKPRKLGKSVILTKLSSSFGDLSPNQYENGNGDIVNARDSLLNDVSSNDLVKGIPVPDIGQEASIQAYARELADHEIAKVEQIMDHMGTTQETTTEEIVTFQNICSQDQMLNVNTWTTSYFTQFFMEATSSMHVTGLNLKLTIYGHLETIDTYLEVIKTYNLKILQKFTYVYLMARVIMIMKAAGGFIGLKISFSAFSPDQIGKNDGRTKSFIIELKKKIFRPDLITNVYQDFKFRVQTLQTSTMEVYYEKHFKGFDKLEYSQAKFGRDEKIIDGICGLTVTMIQMIMSEKSAHLDYLNKFSEKSDIPLEYVNKFLNTFGHLFVPDLDDFGNPLKEKNAESEGKEVGFYRQNCYSMAEKDLLGDKKDDGIVRFVNVFSLLTFIIFGKDFNLPSSPFFARNFFSRSYMSLSQDNVGGTILYVVEKDLFLLFTELKESVSFYDYFLFAKSYRNNLIFHINFIKDFLVVPIEKDKKIDLFSAFYGSSGIYPSYVALKKEVPDKAAKEMAQKMFLILNNIYLIYCYMRINDEKVLKDIKFDADAKEVYTAIIKFMINSSKMIAYYESEDVKDKTIADNYLDVITYLCYKTGTPCTDYQKPEYKTKETVDTLKTKYSFKIVITILTTYQCFFSGFAALEKFYLLMDELKVKLTALKMTKLIWRCRSLDAKDTACKDHYTIYTQWVEIFRFYIKTEYVVYFKKILETMRAFKHPALGEETERLIMIYLLKFSNTEKANIATWKPDIKLIYGKLFMFLYPLIYRQYTTVISDNIKYNFLIFIYRLLQTNGNTFLRKFKFTSEQEIADLKLILYHVCYKKFAVKEKPAIRKEDVRAFEKIKDPKSYLLMIETTLDNLYLKVSGTRDPKLKADWKTLTEGALPPANTENPDPAVYIRMIEMFSKLAMYAQIFDFYDTFQSDHVKYKTMLDYGSQNFMNAFYNYFIIASHSISSGVFDIYDFQEYIYEKMNDCMIASASLDFDVDLMAICHNFSHRKWAELYYFVKYVYVQVKGTPNLSVVDYYSDKESISCARMFLTMIEPIAPIMDNVKSICVEEANKKKILCISMTILEIIRKHVASTNTDALTTEELNDKIYILYGQDKSPDATMRLQSALLLACDSLMYYSEGNVESTRLMSFFDYSRADTLKVVSTNKAVTEIVNKQHQFYDKKVFILKTNDNTSKEYLSSYLRRTFDKYEKDDNEKPFQMAVNKLLEAKSDIIERFFIYAGLPEFAFLKPILQYTNQKNYDKLSEMMINNNIFLQIPRMNKPKSDQNWIRFINWVGCLQHADLASYDKAAKVPNWRCEFKSDSSKELEYLKRLLAYLYSEGRFAKLDKDLDLDGFNEDVSKNEAAISDVTTTKESTIFELKRSEIVSIDINNSNRKSIDGFVKTVSFKDISVKRESVVISDVVTVVPQKTPVNKQEFTITYTMSINSEDGSCEEMEEEKKKFIARMEELQKQFENKGKIVNIKMSTPVSMKGLPEFESINTPKNTLVNEETLQSNLNTMQRKMESFEKINTIERSSLSFGNSQKLSFSARKPGTTFRSIKI